MPLNSRDDEPRPESDADDAVDETVGHSAGSAAGGRIVEEIEAESQEQVKVRRSPRYFRFMFAGAVVFASAAFIATYSLPQGQGYSRNEVFGFVLVISLAVGVAVGAAVALLANVLMRRTERTVVADHLDVRVVDGGGAEPDGESRPGSTASGSPV